MPRMPYSWRRVLRVKERVRRRKMARRAILRLCFRIVVQRVKIWRGMRRWNMVWCLVSRLF